MKNFVLSLILVLNFNSDGGCQTETTNKSGITEFSEIVIVETVTASKLLSRAKFFISKNSESAKDVIQDIDDSTYTIIAKGYISKDDYGGVYCTVIIQCKDNKYRYLITDIRHIAIVSGKRYESEFESKKCNMPGVGDRAWEKVKSSIKESIISYTNKLKNSMLSALDEW